MTEAPRTLAAALAQLQADLPTIMKGRTAEVKMDGGGKYTYDYADLAGISSVLLPKLAEVGLSFSAKPTLCKDGQFLLVYMLRHVSGQSDGGRYPLPDPAKSKPQVLGSAITYARRYALCSITGVAPESDDDDARAASKTRRAPSSDEANLAQLKGDIWVLAKSRGIDGAGVVSRYEAWSGSAMSDASVADLRGFLRHMGATRTAQRKPVATKPAVETPTTPSPGDPVIDAQDSWPEPPADWEPGL